MKKMDDDLLRLAFGELDPEAARSVEARVGASDRPRFEAYRRLHDDLHRLPPPPSDGLSAERLRAAILDREMKGRSKPFAFPLVFAPVALAALAFAVILPRLKPRPEPRLVMGDPPVRSQAFDAAPLPRFEVSKETIVAPTLLKAQEQVARAVEAQAAPRNAPAPKAAPLRRRRARTIGRAPDVLVAQAEAASSEVPRNTLVASAAPATIAAPPSAVVESAPGVAGTTETVVVVSSKRDLETGAPAAMEKEAASVLVGG